MQLQGMKNEAISKLKLFQNQLMVCKEKDDWEEAQNILKKAEKIEKELKQYAKKLKKLLEDAKLLGIE